MAMLDYRRVLFRGFKGSNIGPTWWVNGGIQIGILWTEPALGIGWLFLKTLSRFSQQKQESMDGSVFFHQKTFPQGHQLNIGVPGSSPVFF